MLATAGGIVAYGTLDGDFKVRDARTGAELYRFKTPSGILGNVTAWRHRGRQYLAVLSGTDSYADWISAEWLSFRAPSFIDQLRAAVEGFRASRQRPASASSRRTQGQGACDSLVQKYYLHSKPGGVLTVFALPE